jgi:UDP-glucose-4-epimerase GalE
MAPDRVDFEKCDILERERLSGLMRSHGIDTVMHFAALAYVGESVTEPLRYYRNNLAGALSLIEASSEAGIERFVFSSTCATYGEPSSDQIPIAESCPQEPVNPYGRSKLMVERILADHAHESKVSGRTFSFAALRYFNVAGSDPEGRIGEDHRPETHLLPICLDVALGKREAITIFGTDYATPDGTCIRDYVHVTDLVETHVTVMNALENGDERRYNIGIGRGYSVRECVEACRRVTGHVIPEVEGERRPGDPPELTSNADHIRDELGITPKFTELDEIIETAWRWYQQHPNGY